MIFNEIYSVYYNTVAKILKYALENDTTEQELQELVAENAFSESVLSIIPSLKSSKWQLMNGDLKPILSKVPTMPLTNLQKRWLKSIASDPRIKLFDVQFPAFDDVEPLFTQEDYKIYDQYLDGDPFGDENYIKNFRTILTAIREHKPVKIIMINRHGKEIAATFFPKGLEYSLKDDKMRVFADGGWYKQFNLARIKCCEFCFGINPMCEKPLITARKELMIEITDERNALERVMLHFAHFEKQAERLDEKRYFLKLIYDEGDETEMVIRILSFGPYVKVIEPESFVKLIKRRLISQKSCGL